MKKEKFGNNSIKNIILSFCRKQKIAASRMHKSREGFTLVEMLVALLIFSLLITMAAQVFLSSIRSEKIMLARFQAFNEAGYNLEHISRAIRMARKDTSGGCIGEPNSNYKITRGGKGIKFKTVNGAGAEECVEIYLQDQTLKEGRTGFPGDLALTSPAVRILQFKIDPAAWGWQQTDNIQPRVTLYLQIEDREGKITDSQTTISQRNADINQ